MSTIIDGVEVFGDYEVKKNNLGGRGLLTTVIPVGSNGGCNFYIKKGDRVPFGYTNKMFYMWKLSPKDNLYHRHRFAGVYEEMKDYIPSEFVRHAPLERKYDYKKRSRKNKRSSSKKISFNDDNILSIFTDNNDDFEYESLEIHNKHKLFVKAKDGDEYLLPFKKSVFNQFRVNKSERNIIVKNPLMKNIYDKFTRDNDLKKFCEDVDKNASDISALSYEDFNQFFEIDKSTIDISRYPNARNDIKVAFEPGNPAKVYRCPITRKLMVSRDMYNYRTSGLIITCRRYLL